MSDTEAFDSLICSIYDAALDATIWPGVMERISRYLVASGASVISEDRVHFDARLYYDYGFDPKWTELYIEKYVALNPLPRIGIAYPVDQVFTQYDLIPAEEFKATKFYLEWVKPQGIVDTAVVNLDKTATSFAALVVRRSEREGLFDEEARQRMARIAPHVRRAVLVGKTIQFHKTKSALLDESLSKLAAAVFLVGTDGRIVFASEAANQLLRDGTILHETNLALVATSAKADTALSGAIAAALQGDEALGVRGTAIELSASLNDRWLAHVLPLVAGTRRNAGQPHLAAAAVFVRKASLDLQWPLDAIGKLYNLTPGEIRVLQGVVDIGGVPAIAEKQGVTQDTVRTHLKNIFAKTGIKRQADLIKLVATHVLPGVG